MRPRRPHRLRLARSSRSGRLARRHAPGSRQQYGASSSPQKLLSGTHGVDDDDCGDALNVANLENKGSSVGSQEHGETISHVPGPDGVVIGVKDVSLAQAVLQRRSGNDRIVHRSKVTCDVLCGRGVWSGVTVVVVAGLTARWACAADVLAAIGVEQVAHACQAAGLMGAATSAQACRFCGLVSRLATIRGGAASVGNLAEVTWGRLCWSGLVAGRGSVAGRGWWALKSRQS